MKKLLLIIAVLSFERFKAQTPYELFNSKSEFFFNRAQLTDELAGLKPDSTKVIGTDSVYYHYRVIAQTNSSCFNSKAVSWTGLKTVRHNNNDFVFFTKTGDTLLVKTAAGLNTAWTFYTYPNGDKIKAQISSVQYEPTFDGMSDTVKTISFQSYSSGNVITSGPLNGETFKFARTQGLIRWANMYEFPSSISFFTRCFGKRLTNGDSYDFNSGDILQTYSYGSGSNGSNETHTTYTFVAKTMSGSTVTYTTNVYTHQKTVSVQSTTVPPGFVSTTSTTTSYTTQVVTVNNATALAYSQMPEQYIPMNASGGSKMSFYFDPVTGNKNCNFYFKIPTCIWYGGNNDTCLAPSVSCQTNSWYNRYNKLGSYFNQTSTSFNQTSIYSIPQFYSTATYSCGTYIYAAINDNSTLNNYVKIYPNPAVGKVFVNCEIPFLQGEIFVSDVVGTIVLRENLSPNASVNFAGLREGIYLLTLKTEKGTIAKKIVKVN